METAVTNLKTIVSGAWRAPFVNGDTIISNGGKIIHVGTTDAKILDDCDVVIDADGAVAIPGLIDSHVHITFAITHRGRKPWAFSKAIPKPLALPARSPNLSAYAERWVRSVKDECLSKIILFGERSLRRALSEYVEHYHAERNHQGKSNVLLFRRVTQTRRQEPVQCRERLGGLLRYYHQEAA